MIHVKKEEPLPVGETVTLKVFVRVYKNHPTQIFGVILEGAEHLDLPEGDTVQCVGKFSITGGIKAVDTARWKSAMSRNLLLEKI